MYFAEPDSKVTGTNTMQIDIVEISAGIATCSALSRMAEARGFFSPVRRLRCVFSISTVASSTSMPTARARPPSDMTFNCQKHGSVQLPREFPSGVIGCRPR
jgi:hypothetical protein